MSEKKTQKECLEQLHIELLKMASLVEESIENTMIALKRQDTELAKAIYLHDDVIDDLEIAIEKKCMQVIALRQPSAEELQHINSTLKILTDLERIADHSSDIAEITIKMASEKYVKPLKDIPRMADLAKEMVKSSIDAYCRKDIALAQVVCQRDDAVDELYHKLRVELTNMMKNNPSTIEQALDFIMIAKYIERMADHATNIAEWAVYNVTGVHSRLARLAGQKELKHPFLKNRETHL